MKSAWVKYAVIIVAGAIGYGSYIISRKADNAVEQSVEAFLRTQGIDIDLSPEDED